MGAANVQRHFLWMLFMMKGIGIGSTLFTNGIAEKLKNVIF
jgi:hypothetical protein